MTTTTTTTAKITTTTTLKRIRHSTTAIKHSDVAGQTDQIIHTVVPVVLDIPVQERNDQDHHQNVDQTIIHTVVVVVVVLVVIVALINIVKTIEIIKGTSTETT